MPTTSLTLKLQQGKNTYSCVEIHTCVYYIHMACKHVKHSCKQSVCVYTHKPHVLVCMLILTTHTQIFVLKDLDFHFTEHLIVFVFLRISFLVMVVESLEALYLSLVTRLRNT